MTAARNTSPIADGATGHGSAGLGPGAATADGAAERGPGADPGGATMSGRGADAGAGGEAGVPDPDVTPVGANEIDAGQAGDPGPRDGAVGGPTAGRRAGDRLDPDALAALEEQRDFLLRSLDDLRKEHAVGDVDDVDFRALEDDYTARAARTIRAIEAHEARMAAARPRRSRARRMLVTAAILVFAVLAGALTAQAAGRRDAGDTVTGGARETTREQLADAVDLAAEGDYPGAIQVYDDVLAEEPDNVEALTFKGWSQFLAGDGSGLVTLIDAVEVDPEYPAARAFLAVVFERLGRPEAALGELDVLETLNPPPDITRMVAGLREELESQVAGGGGDTSGD